jgi:hypothetical protein
VLQNILNRLNKLHLIVFLHPFIICMPLLLLDEQQHYLDEEEEQRTTKE